MITQELDALVNMIFNYDRKLHGLFAANFTHGLCIMR